MPVRRTLQMESVINVPASKIPIPARNHTASTGTTSSQADVLTTADHGRSFKRRKTKVATHEEKVPRTELEKLDSLRSKLEQSVDAFIKARKELEEILTAEGSSEQALFFSGSSSDLKTELKRHRELTSRLESSVKEKKDPKHQN